MSSFVSSVTRASTVGLLSASIMVAGCGGKSEPAGEDPVAAERAKLEANRITPEQAKAFADGYKVEGYESKMAPVVTGTNVMLNLEGKPRDNGASIKLEVFFGSCMDVGCNLGTLDEHKASRSNVEHMVMTPVDRENPDLVLDLFETKFGNERALGIFKLSFSAKKTDDGGVTKSTSNFVSLEWKDAKNVVRVKAQALDWGAEDQKQLAERTPRDLLEAEAKKGLEAAMKHVVR
jgi:uncharacterized protein (DUF2384 family)